MENQRLAYLSSVIELLNEIINRSMIQPIDINLMNEWKILLCYDMMIDPICFCQVKKNTNIALSESDLYKGKIWILSTRKRMSDMTTIRRSNNATSELSCISTCYCRFSVAYVERLCSTCVRFRIVWWALPFLPIEMVRLRNTSFAMVFWFVFCSNMKLSL